MKQQHAQAHQEALNTRDKMLSHQSIALYTHLLNRKMISSITRRNLEFFPLPHSSKHQLILVRKIYRQQCSFEGKTKFLCMSQPRGKCDVSNIDRMFMLNV